MSLLVLVVFAIGQMLEGYVLVPRLVGEKIGLHPVAVIFAVLAGGELFGFLGVLLALPVASVVHGAAALRARALHARASFIVRPTSRSSCVPSASAAAAAPERAAASRRRRCAERTPRATA